MNTLTAIISALADHSPVRISGLPGSAPAYVARALMAAGRSLVVLATDEDEAHAFAANLRGLEPLLPAAGASVALLVSTDPWQSVGVLGRLAADSGAFTCVVTLPAALAQPTSTPDCTRSHTVLLAPGDTISLTHLTGRLAVGGYARVDFVESPGEFACRGAVLDLWPAEADAPFRVVFDDAFIESIRVFDVYTQRSHAPQGRLIVFPLAGSGPSTAAAFLRDAPADRVIFCLQPDVDEPTLTGARLIVQSADSDGACDAGCVPGIMFNRQVDLFVRQLERWQADGYTVSLVSGTAGEEERLKELVEERRPGLSRYPAWFLGSLLRGFIDCAGKQAVVANGEIFNRIQRPARRAAPSGGKRISTVGELAAGDYVVHAAYGIGRYRGLARLASFGVEGDYLALEYKHGDKLFVPIEDFPRVQKFIGVEGKRPRLYGLDGFAWQRATLKARAGAESIARELIATAARRAARPGHAFTPDNHMEDEFARQFPFPETPDQSRSIQEVAEDMTAPHPMDRLLCGDVGYGKTEVAMRASLKAVIGSRQVAVLAPTTILAEQHFQTFSERFADFPVMVEMLSRFKSPAAQREIIRRLQDGTVDIVIGTHRLLQKDVRFRGLGLMVIDEEQRFGVRAKEQLKKIKESVDVLTLSATPIPRTLAFGLAGVRGLSLIETPPEGRLPIRTHVGPHDDELIRRAFAAELDRRGRIFYVYNRVASIQSRLASLHEQFPGMRFTVVHGQMRPAAIEEAMFAFMHGKSDCLVATSIIESGLDIPEVNTLIVEDAGRLGLAQLYQLRGRVGRQARQAYCYLFYEPGSALTEESRRRLDALREFTALGSGFRLAMRDLEIRGAGDFLGKKQHGFINEVGFDFYTQLLREELGRLSIAASSAAPSAAPSEIHLRLAAHLPADYIPTDEERIGYYRRLLEVRTAVDRDRFAEELRDRFGPMPLPVQALLEIGLLRGELARHGVTALSQQDTRLSISFGRHSTLNRAALIALASAQPEAVSITQSADHLRITVRDFFSGSEADTLPRIRKFLYKLV